MIFTSSARLRKQKKASFKWLQLVLIMALFGVFLVVLFPKKLFINNILSEKEPSEISLNYLSNLVNDEPNNQSLKITLATEEIKAGQIDLAKRVITPLVSFVPQKPLEWQALWLYYQIVRVESFQLAEKTPERLQKEKSLKQLMGILINSPLLSYKQKVELANNEILAGEPENAYKMYGKILQETQHIPTPLYLKVGSLALSVKEYKQSADFYHKAMLQTNDLDKKRQYFGKALQALEFSGQPLNALIFAEGNIDGLSNDRETLMLVVNVALSAGKPQTAEKYIDKLMKITVKS